MKKSGEGQGRRSGKSDPSRKAKPPVRPPARRHQDRSELRARFCRRDVRRREGHGQQMIAAIATLGCPAATTSISAPSTSTPIKNQRRDIVGLMCSRTRSPVRIPAITGTVAKVDPAALVHATLLLELAPVRASSADADVRVSHDTNLTDRHDGYVIDAVAARHRYRVSRR